MFAIPTADTQVWEMRQQARLTSGNSLTKRRGSAMLKKQRGKRSDLNVKQKRHSERMPRADFASRSFMRSASSLSWTS
jgi:hypothetical protein